MYTFHKDKARYFDIQYRTARDFILPFIERSTSLQQPLRILEIGCAEAGVLKAFLEKGHDCTGIELLPGRIELARQFHADALSEGRIRFVNKNVYDIDVKADLGEPFDVIILKDVIEHIPQQERFIPALRDFLKPGGVVFFGFPPWQMPFGGHQQKARNKLLSVAPWYHLLPMPVYLGILRLFGENRLTRNGLKDIKETGISIERFERIVRKSGYEKLQRELYLISPIYKFKFGLKPRKLPSWLQHIPWARNFYATAAYFTIGLSGKP